MARGALACCFATGFGIPLGFFTAVRKGHWPDYAGSLLALLAICIPALVIGPILIMDFAIKWRWFPVAFWGGVWHAVLPTLTLGLYFAGNIFQIPGIVLFLVSVTLSRGYTMVVGLVVLYALLLLGLNLVVGLASSLLDPRVKYE